MLCTKINLAMANTCFKIMDINNNRFISQTFRLMAAKYSNHLNSILANPRSPRSMMWLNDKRRFDQIKNTCYCFRPNEYIYFTTFFSSLFILIPVLLRFSLVQTEKKPSTNRKCCCFCFFLIYPIKPGIFQTHAWETNFLLTTRTKCYI